MNKQTFCKTAEKPAGHGALSEASQTQLTICKPEWMMDEQ